MRRFLIASFLAVACTASGTPIDSQGNDETGDDDGDQGFFHANRDVDILFVIDNSATMGEAQARLASDIDALLDVLDAPGVRANYRIGITTTDDGNPWCSVATTPERGRLVLSSCKDRLDEFVTPSVDARDLACNDLCMLGSAELEITPTVTELDPDSVQRPWLQNIGGVTNLPAGTDIADAFRCFGPQGIDGCQFESPLESMYLALDRSQDPAEAHYGFMREGAVLAIVLVTDAGDCSYDEDWSDIFAQDGNKTFWSDPQATVPTAAVCWNAGVVCTGDPSGYDACEPVDKSIDGAVGVDADDAVLHGVDRYTNFLQQIENDKYDLNPDQQVVAGLIGGVTEDGSVFYADAEDPAYQDEFGIGPGCISAMGNPAVPPVRTRAVVRATTPDSLYSICSADYSPALESIAEAIREQLDDGCFSRCVADSDPQTAILDPQCMVEEQAPGPDEPTPIAECLRDGDGSYVLDPETGGHAMPSDGVNVCHAFLVGNDISPECRSNLAFVIERRPGFGAPSATQYTATCSLSGSPAVDCPDLD